MWTQMDKDSWGISRSCGHWGVFQDMRLPGGQTLPFPFLLGAHGPGCVWCPFPSFHPAEEVWAAEITLGRGRWPGLTFPAPPGHCAGIWGVCVAPQCSHLCHGRERI